MTWLECSRCRFWFKAERGYVRFHHDQRGNVCPGSGLEPFELKTLWDVLARRSA